MGRKPKNNKKKKKIIIINRVTFQINTNRMEGRVNKRRKGGNNDRKIVKF